MPPSLSLSLSLFKLQRNYILSRNTFVDRNDQNSPERLVQTGIVRYLKRNEIRVYRYRIVHRYEKLLLYWPVRNDIDFLGLNADTGRILECNRIVGLPLPERKIPTGTDVRDRAPGPFYECWAKPTRMGGVVLLPLKMEVRLVIFSP